MELKVLDNKGQASGNVDFDDKLVATKASKALLHEVVNAYLADQRSGTHFTKTRAEVSGGGVKPWKQKGTGRARSGSTRSPLWRHGGIIFGPRPRNYHQDLPKHKKKLAFRMAMKEAVADGRLQVVEEIAISEPKTKLVAAVYNKWQAPTDSLLVVDKIESKFEQAARNIANVTLINAESLNTYHCLRARRIFITKPALDLVTARITKSLEN